MSLINFPILYVPDPTKGRPLFAGQIYVGQPDLDPTIVINQKQLNIIKEDGTIVPVAQPFTLSAGGVPTYNGNPVRLDVDGNYSIKILSKLGAQIYYIENAFSLLYSDLSQPYIFDTVALFKASTIEFPVGKTIHLNDRDADFIVIAGTGTGNTFGVIASTSVNQSIEIVTKDSRVLLSQLLDTPLTAAAAVQYGVDNYTTTVIDVDITSDKVTIPSNRYIKINKKVTSKAEIVGALFTNDDHAGGNSNIFIYGKGEIDGNKLNQTTGDNYGIHLVNVSVGYIKGIRIHDCKVTTAPGNEGAIYGEDCVAVVMEGVEAYENIGCGIIFRAANRCGSVRCISHDNVTGSGIIFYQAQQCYSDNDLIYNNEYTNLNLSGQGSTIINPKSYGSGFSGINIGETTDPLNFGHDSLILGGNSYSNTFDGLTIQGSDRVRVVGLNCYGNLRQNCRIFDSCNHAKLLGVIFRNSTTSISNGLLIDGGTSHFVGGGSEFHDNSLYGISVQGTSEGVTIDNSVKCYDNGQVTTGNSAGILLGTTTSNCTVEAECYDTQGTKTQESGVWNAGGDGHIMRNPYTHDNKTHQYRETSSPTNTTKDKIKLNNNSFSGLFTAITSTVQVITNGNARDPNRIQISARNPSAVTLGQPFVSSVVIGVSFSITYPTVPAGTEDFSFEIN